MVQLVLLNAAAEILHCFYFSLSSFAEQIYNLLLLRKKYLFLKRWTYQSRRRQVCDGNWTATCSRLDIMRCFYSCFKDGVSLACNLQWLKEIKTPSLPYEFFLCVMQYILFHSCGYILGIAKLVIFQILRINWCSLILKTKQQQHLGLASNYMMPRAKYLLP